MRLSREASVRRTISLTPLIDVVFLLLVFFMLASTFMRFTSLPIATAGQGASALSSEQRVLLIHVGPDGRVTANGSAVAREQLDAHLAQMRDQGFARVLIALRPGAKVGDLAATLSKVRRMKFERIQVIE